MTEQDTQHTHLHTQTQKTTLWSDSSVEIGKHKWNVYCIIFESTNNYSLQISDNLKCFYTNMSTLENNIKDIKLVSEIFIRYEYTLF